MITGSKYSDISATADAITNSVIQEIAKSLARHGCRGGLGDSRALRATVHEMVSLSLQRMVDRDATGLRNFNWSSQ